MEDFTKHCLNSKPNITYMAIGSAYSTQGGNQQHPPFLEALLKSHPEFIYEVILIDPVLEDPPEIARYYHLRDHQPNSYGKHNLNVYAIRELFDFESVYNTKASQTIKFMMTLINRVITSKMNVPNKTHLLFVHDFSGASGNIIKLSSALSKLYLDPNVQYLYQKNVLIDLNNKIDGGCYVDLTSIFFHPELVLNANGAYEIFNPNWLDDFDIYTIICTQTNRNTKIKILLAHMLKHRLNGFATMILPLYRYIRICLESSVEIDLKKIAKDDAYQILFADIDQTDTIDSTIVAKIASNMVLHLRSITGYLDLFKEVNARHECFGEFYEYCCGAEMKNPYNIIKIFLSCLAKLESFIKNINPNTFFVEINYHAINYVRLHGKLPLFMELLLQDK